jgi:hypothetical protein
MGREEKCRLCVPAFLVSDRNRRKQGKTLEKPNVCFLSINLASQSNSLTPQALLQFKHLMIQAFSKTTPAQSLSSGHNTRVVRLPSASKVQTIDRGNVSKVKSSVIKASIPNI